MGIRPTPPSVPTFNLPKKLKARVRPPGQTKQGTNTANGLLTQVMASLLSTESSQQIPDSENAYMYINVFIDI